MSNNVQGGGGGEGFIIMNERRVELHKKLPICVRRGCSKLQLEFLFNGTCSSQIFNFEM